MDQLVSDYIKDIHDLFLGSQVTDLNGQTMDFRLGIREATDLVISSNSKGKKVIFIGNGGSAAVANHKALDFWFTGKIRGISFSDDALLTCVSNDFGYSHVFARPINMFADAGDVLVAISSSGNSENIVLATEEARRRGCHIITFSGFEPTNRLRKIGNLNFHVASKHFNKVESTHLLICDCILEQIVFYRNQFITTNERNGGSQSDHLI